MIDNVICNIILTVKNQHKNITSVEEMRFDIDIICNKEL